MEVIHESSNNIVTIQLCATEKNNGDLELLRAFCSATEPRPPESSIIRAEERHAVMEYLNRQFGKRGKP